MAKNKKNENKKKELHEFTVVAREIHRVIYTVLAENEADARVRYMSDGVPEHTTEYVDTDTIVSVRMER